MSSPRLGGQGGVMLLDGGFPVQLNTGEQLEMFYPSPSLGWFGVWMFRAGPDADKALEEEVSACDDPRTTCYPSRPKLITLTTGTKAVLNDPGGVRWVQAGIVYIIAGPWADFPPTTSVPLANRLSEAIDGK